MAGRREWDEQPVDDKAWGGGGGQDEKEMTGWTKGTSSRRVKRSSMFRST